MTPYNLKLSSEYLIRAELSRAERTMHIGKRKKLYEKLHPETRATEVGGPGRAKTRRQIGDDIAERFTKNTAKKRNRPERRSSSPWADSPSRCPEVADQLLLRVDGDHQLAGRLLTPAIEKLKQCALVDRELLQRLALDARHDAGNQPARQAHFQDTDTMLNIRSLRRRSIIASTPMRE
jgi:hypothetical protein